VIDAIKEIIRVGSTSHSVVIGKSKCHARAKNLDTVTPPHKPHTNSIKIFDNTVIIICKTSKCPITLAWELRVEWYTLQSAT
jgi:hypothetical protein